MRKIMIKTTHEVGFASREIFLLLLNFGSIKGRYCIEGEALYLFAWINNECVLSCIGRNQSSHYNKKTMVLLGFKIQMNSFAALHKLIVCKSLQRGLKESKICLVFQGFISGLKEELKLVIPKVEICNFTFWNIPEGKRKVH